VIGSGMFVKEAKVKNGEFQKKKLQVIDLVLRGQT